MLKSIFLFTLLYSRVDELSLAVRALKTRVHFGLYHSLYEWYNPMYIQDREANFTTNEFVEKKVGLVENFKKITLIILKRLFLSLMSWWNVTVPR